MKKIITLLLILLFTTKSTFSQSPNNIEKFTVVCVNDKDSILNKIKMSTPQFYNIGKGKRIEIKVCNEDSIQIRRVRCLFILFQLRQERMYRKNMDFPSHWLRNLLFLYERGYPPNKRRMA